MKEKQAKESAPEKDIVLSPVKIRQFNEQPAVSSSLMLSKDGKWLIHKTIITDIKPVTYLEKVLGNPKTE